MRVGEGGVGCGSDVCGSVGEAAMELLVGLAICLGARLSVYGLRDLLLG